MSRSASEPLRALTEEEKKELQRVSRASSETRIRHQRAVDIFGVSAYIAIPVAAIIVWVPVIRVRLPPFLAKQGPRPLTIATSFFP